MLRVGVLDCAFMVAARHFNPLSDAEHLFCLYPVMNALSALSRTVGGRSEGAEVNFDGRVVRQFRFVKSGLSGNYAMAVSQPFYLFSSGIHQALSRNRAVVNTVPKLV